MIVWPFTQHRTESSAGGTGALAGACLTAPADRVGPSSETLVSANRTVVRRPRTILRVPLIAVCTGAVGWLATGLLGAAAAGATLVVLAASDLASHRFSVLLLGAGTAVVVVALTIDSVRNESWSRMAVCATGTAGVATLLAIAWLSTSGIAFGDVLLATFAIAVPLYVSMTAAVVTVLATLVAAALYIVVRAARRGASRAPTVPLGPALLVGWLCGVVLD